MRIKVYSFVLVIICLGAGSDVFAQPNFPDRGQIFKDDIVPRIDIYIDEDSLDWIYDNIYSNHEFQVIVSFNNGEIFESVQNVGFRLRGNTSRDAEKKSFKLAFDAFQPNARFHGLRKMNLNGEHNDPSIIRSKLCWDMLEEMHVPASLANHVEVYINADYYGLYINVEHIDERFLQRRFDNQDGNLYKLSLIHI